jgi:FdhD protein
MQTNNYQGLKVIGDRQSAVRDELVVEAPLQININGESYTVVMRTPGNDIDLIRGLLYAEDIYKQKAAPTFSIIEKQDGIPKVIDVSISKNELGKGYLNKRTLLSVSSCGICGKQELEDINPEGKSLDEKASFSPDILFAMLDQFHVYQKIFKDTGGSHAAGVFDQSFQFLTLREDIGRHNAVDKCVGHLLEESRLKAGTFLVVSGRVSYEIVSKAFIAKIPVIIAVSACSSMAVDYAKELGICLIGFTRGDNMTIYSNPTFLKTKAPNEF